MIRVQQIADLEARVLRAVDLIERLRADNRKLSAELSSSRERLRESEVRSKQLEEMLDSLRSDQENVEQIILRTLDKLDGLEDDWAEMQQQEDRPAAPAGQGAVPADLPPAPPNPPDSGAAATGDRSFGTGGAP